MLVDVTIGRNTISLILDSQLHLLKYDKDLCIFKKCWMYHSVTMHLKVMSYNFECNHLFVSRCIALSVGMEKRFLCVIRLGASG